MRRWRVTYQQTMTLHIDFDAPSSCEARAMFENSTWGIDAEIVEYNDASDHLRRVEEVSEP